MNDIEKANLKGVIILGIITIIIIIIIATMIIHYNNPKVQIQNCKEKVLKTECKTYPEQCAKLIQKICEVKQNDT